MKPYDELEFTDNFMFVKILTAYPDLCKEMLELILNKKIRSLKMTDYEVTRIPAYTSRGIRMDVYTEDEEGVVYDIEMQSQPDRDIAKRSRYYHSVMDMEQLTRGTDYSELKKSVVIFICKEKIDDRFTKPIYTFRYRSEEDPDVCMGDESFTVYVNAQCSDKELTPKTRGFIEYIRSGKTSESKKSLAARLKNVVEDAKAQRKWSVDYMTWEDEWKHREFLFKKELEQAHKEIAELKEKLAEKTVSDAGLTENKTNRT